MDTLINPFTCNGTFTNWILAHPCNGAGHPPGKNCTLTQVRQFLKKELAKIMQKDSKVNKLVCLCTENA